MRIVMFVFLMSLIHSAYSELVRMDFEVMDIDGKPIAGAVIRISTSKRLTLPYQKPEKKKFSCTTGKDGAATERFFCWDGCVNCYISADGYYRAEENGQYSSSIESKVVRHVNDANLEFDTHKNLADKNIGTFYP